MLGQMLLEEGIEGHVMPLKDAEAALHRVLDPGE